MEAAGNIYLTHSSFITTTAAVFTLLSGFFLLFLKKKSKATIDLAVVFISISFTSIAFTFAFVFYHPNAAYHRWLTVTPVLIGLLFLARFFFHFPTERAGRFARVATIVLIIIALIDGVLWIHATLSYGKEFHGISGMWDVSHSRFAAINSAIIGLYIFLVIAAGIWRVIITSGRDRYRVLSILCAFIISTIIPGIANSMARQGAMELNTFILTYATLTIIGWFITLMLYINYTTDYIPFMVRIVGICVITFLLCLVGISYVIAQDYDRHYDEISVSTTERMIADPDFRPGNVRYFLKYQWGNNPEWLFVSDGAPMSHPHMASSLRNSITVHRIIHARNHDELIRTLNESDSTFSGYTESLRAHFLRKNISPGAIKKYFNQLRPIVSYMRYRILTLHSDNFRDSLFKLLSNSPAEFSHFSDRIQQFTRLTNLPDESLRNETLYLLSEPVAPKSRFTTEGQNGQHHMAFRVITPDGILYQAGFDYRDYRLTIHSSALKMYLLLGALLLVVIAGIPLFMRASLSKPIYNLVAGLERVASGNLDIALPVVIQDEIGFLTHSFNAMVQAMRLANQERAIAEEALRLAEARFRGIVEHSLAGIYVIQQGKFVYVNPTFAKIFGYSVEEILELPSPLDIVDPADRDEVARSIKARESSPEPVVKYSYRGRKKDGTIVHIESLGTSIQLGGAIAVMGTVLDITQSRRTRLALIQEKERLLVTLASIGDGVIAVDMNGNITLINHVAQELTGWAFHEAIGEKLENIYQILDESTLKPCPNSAEIILKQNQENAFQQKILLRRDGTRRFISERGTCMHDNNNLVVGVVLVFHDITEEKMHQNELARMRLLLKRMIDSMPSILIGIDREEKIIYWNSQSEVFTGLKEQEVSGKKVLDVLPFLMEYFDSVRAACSSGQPRKAERIQAEKNGIPIQFEMTAYPLIAADMEGAVIRLDDVTARLRMEEMIIQTEKMVSLGGLAAGMAHEINNPLGGIMMGSQNILRRIEPSHEKNRECANICGIEIEKIHEYMEKRGIITILQGILEMGERASEIVENMLSFSRRSESSKSSADLRELTEKALELASNEYDLKKKWDFRHIEIIREYGDDIPPIPCVKTEIQQVILNLLKNAAYAMGKKTYVGSHPQITIRLKKEDGMVRLDIADNGIGMDSETKKRVFEPFFTTKEAGMGTGLGLSVSYFIITNNHSGQMEVESNHGIGTTFTIRLPIA